MEHRKPSHSRAKRLFHHLLGTRSAARRAFPSPLLKSIQASIAAGEERHRAQVKLIVEAALSAGAVWRGESARQRAHELFARYRVWDTEENCGVLLYVNLADHKVEIVADRSAARAVTREQWQEVCSIMSAGYARGDYRDGTLAALERLHAILADAMPRHGGPDRNELSDKPVML